MESRDIFGLIAAALGVGILAGVLWCGQVRILSHVAPGFIDLGTLGLSPGGPKLCGELSGVPCFPRDSNWPGIKLAARYNELPVYTGRGLPVAAISRGMPIAQGVLGASGGANSCAALFELPAGVTPVSLLNRVEMVFQNLHNADYYAEEFDPSDPGNPDPSTYTIVFNAGAGNLNIRGGPVEAADTIVHELIHVAFGMSRGAWVRNAIALGWVNSDGGDDPATQAAQARNDEIVRRNCFQNAAW